MRPAYTLGGTGGGIVYDEAQLRETLEAGLSASLIHQALLETSLLGWKEVEYEVLRDSRNNCIIVCNMENIDPVGVHTGDSIVVAPSQTLSDVEYQMLRTSSLNVIRALNVQGGCNIQFALHPQRSEYAIIEVNPRVSRSSALASKATGYPIAKISTRIALGQTLDQIPNPVTGVTKAAYEPTLDYVVVKIPRWPFDKFPLADTRLGTQMKSTGEAMGIGRTFRAALMKAVRGLDLKRETLTGLFDEWSDAELEAVIAHPTHERLFAVCELLRRGADRRSDRRAVGHRPVLAARVRRARRAREAFAHRAATPTTFARRWSRATPRNRIAMLTGTPPIDYAQGASRLPHGRHGGRGVSRAIALLLPLARRSRRDAPDAASGGGRGRQRSDSHRAGHRVRLLAACTQPGR